MPSSKKIRVGAVNYLNTKPLVFGLESSAPQVELVLDFPSRLADRLAAGELDVALIPSIEYFHDPRYTIVSDACIACRGPVLSVKLFSRVPVEQIRTLALDEGSRTSAALVRILLKERFQLDPEFWPLALDVKQADRAMIDPKADATLVIGDRAIRSPGGSFAEVWDLGDEWCRWAELPFVFAMWTARSGAELHGVEAALAEARDRGLRHLPEIAEADAAALGLSRPECIGYLRDNLYFHLGPQEMRGLDLFYRLAQKMNLAPAGVELGTNAC